MHAETVKVHKFNLQREAAAHTSYDLENIQTKTSTAKWFFFKSMAVTLLVKDFINYANIFIK